MLALMPFLFAIAAASAPATAAFRADVDRFLESHFRLNPQEATEAGDHRFDGDVEDLSGPGIGAMAGNAEMWREKFRRYDPKTLSPHDEADREWLISELDGRLLRIREMRRPWKRPDLYLPTAAIYGLIQRDFAPLEERMQLVTRRERAWMPNFDAARRNLTAKETPRVAVEIALSQMGGTRAFFEKDLPAAFASLPDGPAKAAFLDANAKMLAAVGSYEVWLREELSRSAGGTFAIGEDAYREMLAADDMVDVPLDELEQIGERELDRLQKEFREVAAKIDPAASPENVAAAVGGEHPPAEGIIPAVSAGLAALRDFVVSHRLATLPTDRLPVVRETPPFARATSFASMDTPGPFEKSEEAFFNVTLPDPSWPEEKKNQLLAFFSSASISDVSVHEVYPGHYTQFLINRLNPDKVRSVFASGSNAEGWALYCEQMMLDQGLHSGEPKFRLAEIEGALIRACRYLVGIRMHAKRMSVDDAAEFFRKNAYMNAHNARVEALRGTMDPGYLRYQLGKLMILKLRDDVARKMGSAFDLGRFHDQFLGEGAIPIRLIRRAMTGSDGPQL